LTGEKPTVVYAASPHEKKLDISTHHSGIHMEEHTWPRSSSAITHPMDQMSMAVLYSVAPKMSSGAR